MPEKIIWFQATNLYSLYLLLWIVIVVVAVVKLTRYYFSSKDVEHSKTGYVLFGSIVGFLGGITNYFYWYGIEIRPYANISIIFFVASIYYAIYKYNLFEVKTALASITKYIVFSLYAYTTFYGLTFLYTQFFGSVTATEPLLIGIIVAPLFAYFLFKLNYYTDLLNRRIFGELHKHADVLNEVSHFLSKNLVREDILKYIENILDSFFEVKYSKVVLGGGDLIHANNPYVYVNKIKQDNGNLISIFLPQRSQSEEYSAMDLEMVQAIGSQLSVALERSELYERVSHFAEYLENEVKKKTEQVSKQKDELSKLLQSKDEILHIVNHQLNTPLSIIKSAGGMVKDGLWTQEKFYEVTTRESERLGQIIKDFWQAEDTADYKNHLKKENVDLKLLIEKIVEEKKLLIKIRSGEVGLKVLLQQNLPQINCDIAQITQVISNYLDNAIAYTKIGDVTVTLTLNSDKVMCEVSDTGIGFSNIEKEKLFSKFARTEGARLSRPDGSGLGLYICKRIINAHNGLVWADSNGTGLGSRFGFSLPIN